MRVGAGPMTTEDDTGRVNQKKRTRMAIIGACREIIRSGAPVAMPDVAKAALVSEATAYRYFPDLAALLNEALAGLWLSPAEALGPVAGSADPVERIAVACEFLLRGVLAYSGAVRAMIAATITRPELAATRPGIRFGLIDEALAPRSGPLVAMDPAQLARLRKDLVAVVSAEALFVLTDLAGLAPEEAIASLVRTATTLTQCAVTQCAPAQCAPAQSEAAAAPVTRTARKQA
jgi:AcrR family transcriptional regulator